MEIRNVVGLILLNEKNEVLLQKKDLRFKYWAGYWCFFGGGIKKGEEPEKAIRREIKSELNYKLKDIRLFKIQDYKEEYRIGKKYIFVAFFNKKISDISLHEGIGFAFFSQEELDSIKIIDHDFEILKEYFKSLN